MQYKPKVHVFQGAMKYKQLTQSKVLCQLADGSRSFSARVCAKIIKGKLMKER